MMKTDSSFSKNSIKNTRALPCHPYEHKDIALTHPHERENELYSLPSNTIYAKHPPLPSFCSSSSSLSS